VEAMQPFERIKEYSKTVCDQVKWKKAHAIITEEIENHLVDQRNAYIAGGADEDAATDQAIAQMGDPVYVGTELDRTHRPKPQWSMIILTAALLITGLLIRIFFISSHEQWLAPMALSMLVGLGLMAAAYFTDFTVIGRHPKTVYFAILALSAAAMLLSPEINGRLYYANYLTLLFPLGFAAIVYATRNKGYLGIILCGFSFIFPAALAFFIPSTSGLLLFTLSGLVILCLAISKKWFKVKVLYGYLLVFTAVAVVLLLVFAMLYGNYRWERIQAVFDPASYPTDAGYIASHIRALVAGSSLIGHGTIPDSAAPLAWVGNNTDYLLTYLIFNVGWIAFIVIMGLLIFFIIKGFMLCSKQKSGLALFVSISVMMTFTLQVLGYVMVNLGFPLIAPVSLPLVSYGNFATVINLALIGVMLSVFRTGDIVKDKNISKARNQSFITYSDGKLIISFSRK
jgi:cell division protein FtsW (lipid II flippase)